MVPTNGGNVPPPVPPIQLTEESKAIFAEGISLLLSRSKSFVMAVQNELDGQNSLQKSHKVASDILNWFLHNTKELYIDDLEDLLFGDMRILFNIVLDDGIAQEMATDLTIMYEECLRQNYESVVRLRPLRTGAQAIVQSRQIATDVTNWHQEWLREKFESAARLGALRTGAQAIPQGRQIATDVTNWHQEWLRQKFESAARLGALRTGAQAIPQGRQLVNEDEEDDDESSGVDDGDESIVEVDEHNDVGIDNQAPPEKAPTEADDGWTEVPSRK